MPSLVYHHQGLSIWLKTALHASITTPSPRTAFIHPKLGDFQTGLFEHINKYISTCMILLWNTNCSIWGLSSFIYAYAARIVTMLPPSPCAILNEMYLSVVVWEYITAQLQVRFGVFHFQLVLVSSKHHTDYNAKELLCHGGKLLLSVFFWPVAVVIIIIIITSLLVLQFWYDVSFFNAECIMMFSNRRMCVG